MNSNTKTKIILYGFMSAIFVSGAVIGGVIGRNQFPKTKTVEIEKSVEKEVVKYVQTENPERELELVSLGMFETSAYDACTECCGKLPTDPNYGKTSTGTRATIKRTIAVDPNIIPYGTEVVINGQTYIAEDTGGAIKGNRIDIFMSDHNTALQYGRRQAEVFVVR